MGVVRRVVVVAVLLAVVAAAAIAVPAGAADIRGQSGTLTTAQTGTTTSADSLLAPDARYLCFAVDVTGTCVVTIERQIIGGTLYIQQGTGLTSTDGELCYEWPMGRYRVATASCTGSATVRWQHRRDA